MKKLQIGDVVHCRNLDEFEVLKEICNESDVRIHFGIDEIQAYDDVTCYRVDGEGWFKELYYADIDFYTYVMNYKIMSIDELRG